MFLFVLKFEHIF